MNTQRLARPIATVTAQAGRPLPKYDGLFVEPEYADGQPYATTGSAWDDEDDDLEAA